MARLADEHDRLTVPAQRPPLWSENVVCIFNAPDSGLAVYTHFSRVAPDPTVWEGILTIYLPGGEVLVSRSFASAVDPQTADAGALRYRCAEPGRRWELRFDGLARRVSTADLAGGFLVDGHVEYVRIAVDATGARPQWAIGHVPEGQSWGNVHIEQECRIAGQIEIDGVVIPVDTHGVRDHSSGVRRYETMISECWSHGFFPGGRAYAAVHLENDEGADLVAGFYHDGTTLHEVRTVKRPGLQDPTGAPRSFTFTIGGDFGEATVEGTLDHACPYALDHPIGQPIGFDLDNPNGTLIVEGPASLELDSEPGYGWLERVARRGALDT